MTRIIVSVEQTDHGTYIVGGDAGREYETLADANAQAEIVSAPVCNLPYTVVSHEYGHVVYHRWTRRPVTFPHTYANAVRIAARKNANINR